MTHKTNRSMRTYWIVFATLSLILVAFFAFRRVPPPSDTVPDQFEMTNEQLSELEQQLASNEQGHPMLEPLPSATPAAAPMPAGGDVPTQPAPAATPNDSDTKESSTSPALDTDDRPPPTDPQPSPSDSSERISELVAQLLLTQKDRTATNDLPDNAAWLALTSIDPDHSKTRAELWKLYEVQPEQQWDALWALVHIDPADTRLFDVCTARLLTQFTDLGNTHHTRILMFLQGPKNSQTIDRLEQILFSAGQFEFGELICPIVAMWQHGDSLDRIMPLALEKYGPLHVENSFNLVFLLDEFINDSAIVKPFSRALLAWYEQPDTRTKLNVPKLVERHISRQ